jgi:hypothetical protein
MHVLDTVSLDPVLDENGNEIVSFYLKETLTGNKYNSIFDDSLPEAIKTLYYDKEN